jgi:hypothetical protein
VREMSNPCDFVASEPSCRRRCGKQRPPVRHPQFAPARPVILI